MRDGNGETERKRRREGRRERAGSPPSTFPQPAMTDTNKRSGDFAQAPFSRVTTATIYDYDYDYGYEDDDNDDDDEDHPLFPVFRSRGDRDEGRWVASQSNGPTTTLGGAWRLTSSDIQTNGTDVETNARWPR